MKKKFIGLLTAAFFAALADLLLSGVIVKNNAGTMQSSYREYDRHYALITDREDSEFWDKVYDSAKEAGEESNVYVERFGENLSEKYDRLTLLQLAIDAKVDGIIFAGDESDETRDLVNKAVENGIPVVTVLNDSAGSTRQCYVGTNNYTLGHEYAEQVKELLEKKEEKASDEATEILVLTDKEQLDVSQNLILLGIRETLKQEMGEDYSLDVETKLIDNTGEFSAEEAIRDIFIDSEELPDIIICLSELNTKCAYQAVVDYNQVGNVNILGFYNSDSVLEAVSKNIVNATITLDTDQMGSYSVQALNEYITTGHTNAYQAVDTQLITKEEASELLANGEAADSNENE